VAASIAAHLAWLDQQINTVLIDVRRLIDDDPILSRNFVLLQSMAGFDNVSAAILPSELPDIAEFTPKALAAFAGLSPSEHSSGSSRRGTGTISRISSERLRRTLFIVRARCQANQQGSAWPRRPHDHRRQAAQDHPGRRRS
jgi:transposase